jgi:hypothetical protein
LGDVFLGQAVDAVHPKRGGDPLGQFLQRALDDPQGLMRLKGRRRAGATRRRGPLAIGIRYKGPALETEPARFVDGEVAHHAAQIALERIDIGQRFRRQDAQQNVVEHVLGETAAAHIALRLGDESVTH